MYYVIDCTTEDAQTLFNDLAAHLPDAELDMRPTIVHSGAALITEDDERFALEVDTETGRTFVTRVRVAAPGENEMTMWQDGRELDRRIQPIEE